jgi:DinB superfamily
MHPRTHELLEYLDRQRAALRATFNEIRSGCCDATTSAGEWSPAEIVEHLALVNRGIAKMLMMKIDEARRNRVAVDTSTEPVLPTIDTNRMQDRSRRSIAPEEVRPKGLAPDVAWAKLERASVALRAAIAAGDGLDLSTVTHLHPRLGALSLYGWIAFVGAHESRHEQQMRERITAR